MEQLAGRYMIAVAALGAVGLIAAGPVATPSLPDVQIRGFDLAANVSDGAGAELNAFYEHVQQSFGGTLDPARDSGVGALISDRDDSALGGIGNALFGGEDTTLDENAVSSLVGAGFDPGPVDQIAVGVNAPEFNPVAGNSSSGLFGVNDNITAAAANFMAISAADVIPALQAAYQSLLNGVVAAELAYNDALVSTQLETVERTFGSDTTASDFVSWVFSVNNATLAQNENLLNSLLGANFDPDTIHGSLVTPLNAEGFTLADWANLLGVSPDALSQAVQTFEASNLFDLLGGVDWTALFAGIF